MVFFDISCFLTALTVYFSYICLYFDASRVRSVNKVSGWIDFFLLSVSGKLLTQDVWSISDSCRCDFKCVFFSLDVSLGLKS